MEGEGKVPRPRSRVGKNARRVLGGGDVRAIATRLRTMTMTDDGEDRINRERRNNHTFETSEREVGRGCLTSTQTRQRGGKRAYLPGPPRGLTGRIYIQPIWIKQVCYKQQMRAEKGFLCGATRVGKAADELDDPRAFHLRACDDLDATKVQENGGDASETRRKVTGKTDGRAE